MDCGTEHIANTATIPMRFNLKSWFLYLTTWMISTFLVLLFINMKADWYVNPCKFVKNALNKNRVGSILRSPVVDEILQHRKHPTDPRPETVRIMDKKMATLPVQFLLRHATTKRISRECANLPELFHIKMNNIYWQHSQLNGGKNNIYFYAAYYDNRKAVQDKEKNTKGDFVRLLAMTDLPFNSQPKCLCQFWFDKLNAPQFSAKASFDYIWNIARGYDRDNFLLPVLVSCPIKGPSQMVPSVVSFVEHHCDNSTVALWVQHSQLFNNFSKLQERKLRNSVNFRSIAVCVKGLTFLREDKSVRLIEWLELLKLLGVQQVFMYELAIQPETRNTLLYYQKKGFVDLSPITLPGDQLNTPELITLYFTKRITSKRLNEVIPYNDCLYRNLYRYDYIALLDIDEVILPKKLDVLTWEEMLQAVAANLKNPKIAHSTSNISKYASICARNVYFFDNFTTDPLDEISSHFHMLNHVMRAYNYTKPGKFVKCFQNVNQALILHNHYPMRCLSSKCTSRPIDLSIGHMHHYRDGCTLDLKDHCQGYLANNISDKTIWKYKDQLLQNANRVLQDLGYLNEEQV